MLRLNYSDHEEMNDDITLYRVYKKTEQFSTPRSGLKYEVFD